MTDDCTGAEGCGCPRHVLSSHVDGRAFGGAMKAATPLRFSVYDVKARCWMGSNDEGTGPRLYDNEILARLACDVFYTTLGMTGISPFVVKAYDGSGIKKKDEVSLVMSVPDALRKMEGR